MAGVFQNIDPPPPDRPASVYPPPLVRGEDTLAGWRGGWGVNILEDARHSSVLYVCKYFVLMVIALKVVAAGGIGASQSGRDTESSPSYRAAGTSRRRA
jgi:hypothetical protein